MCETTNNNNPKQQLTWAKIIQKMRGPIGLADVDRNCGTPVLSQKFYSKNAQHTRKALTKGAGGHADEIYGSTPSIPGWGGAGRTIDPGVSGDVSLL